jgi:hypothetical protein
VQHYIHENGRRCTRGEDMVWRHWDHEQPEPAPAEARDYTCRMDHWLSRIHNGPLPPMPEENSSDRGDFGVPTMGQGAREMLKGATFTAGPGKSAKLPSMPDYVMTIKQDSISIDYGDKGLDVDAQTPEAEYILAKVLPKVLEDFLINNAKYARAQTGHDLGAKGIIPDINRKTSVLISRLWFDEADAGRDTNEELIDDLIGHLLLMRAKMR